MTHTDLWITNLDNDHERKQGTEYLKGTNMDP